MPVYGNSVSIPANDNVQVLAGTRIEFMPNNAVGELTLAETAAVTGVESDAFINDVAIKERGGVSLQNRVPILEDIIASGILAAPSSRITWTFYNTTGAAIIVFFRLDCKMLNPASVR